MKINALILSVLALFCLAMGQAAEQYGKLIPAAADVATGRLNSYYTLYRLKPMDDAPGTVHAWKEAEGCFHFRLEWQVHEGQLIGCWQGKTA